MGLQYARAAIAIVHSEPPLVFMAEDADVLARVLAIELLAPLDPDAFLPGALADLQQAVLDERWGDAVFEWIGLTDTAVDVYDGEKIWTDAQLSVDDTMLELRLSPLMRASDGDEA
jgi:hypothetical protein